MQSATSTNSTSGDRVFPPSAAITGRGELFRGTWSGSHRAHSAPGREQTFLNSAKSDLVATEAHGANSPVPEEASTGGRQKSVLVVDDEESIRDLLIATLEEAGYRVAAAADGFDGLHRFQESHWDAVITDRNMPELDGEALAARIRAESPSTPIILISGAVSAVCTPELFDALISKPFRMSRILATLHTVLATPG